jgi:hypothetical protein
MAHHPRSRHPSLLEYPLHFRLLRSRWLLSAALLAGAALAPHAHAQNNNGAQGNGQAAAAKGNANGVVPQKTAAQRSQDDAQRLLGGPKTTLGGYEMNGATPDTQREALLNSERMRVAKPNTQVRGGPAAAGNDAAPPAPAAGIRRPARGGAAAGGGAGAADNGRAGAGPGPAGQRGAVNAADAGGAATAVYGSPYSNRAGRDVFKSPW